MCKLQEETEDRQAERQTVTFVSDFNSNYRQRDRQWHSLVHINVSCYWLITAGETDWQADRQQVSQGWFTHFSQFNEPENNDNKNLGLVFLESCSTELSLSPLGRVFLLFLLMLLSPHTEAYCFTPVASDSCSGKLIFVKTHNQWTWLGEITTDTCCEN